jgi:hypothetical protein
VRRGVGFLSSEVPRSHLKGWVEEFLVSLRLWDWDLSRFTTLRFFRNGLWCSGEWSYRGVWSSIGGGLVFGLGTSNKSTSKSVSNFDTL